MSIDDLTDGDFWNAYKNTELNVLFEPYLIKHKAHPRQEGQPGYSPNNTEWYSEAKKDPRIVNAIKTWKSAKNAAPNQKTESSSGLFHLTQRQSAIGLAAVLAGISFLSGFPYIPPPLY